MEELLDKDGNPTGIFLIKEDEPSQSANADSSPEGRAKGDETNVSTSSEATNENVVVGNTMSVEEKLSSKTLAENFDASLKIMGIGMAAVFGVLFVLYVLVKIMGHFAKGKKDNEEN